MAAVAGSSSRFHHLVPLTAVQGAGLLCGLIGVRWMSAVVPPALLGIYGLLLSTVQLAATVTHQGFIKHAQRHWDATLPAGPYIRLLARPALRLILPMTMGLAGVLALLHFMGDVPFDAGVLLWMVAVNVLLVVAQMAYTALQAEERYWAGFAGSAIGSATRSFLPPLFATLAGASLLVLNTGFALHAVAAAGTTLLLLRNAWRRTGKIPGETRAALPKMTHAFVGVGLYGWLAAAAPRWFAAMVLTPEAMGYFVLAGNLTLIIPASFVTIAQGYSFPALFDAARSGADNRALRRLSVRPLAIVMLGSQAALMALALAAPWLIGLIIDARYAGATGWLLATGGAVLAATSIGFFHNLLLARNREADCLQLSLISAGVRLAAMAVGAVAGESVFSGTLIALPWLTVVVEWWYTDRRLRDAHQRA